MYVSFLFILQVIRWPTPQQQVDIARYIEDKCALPGVVGFLDGCHIRLSSALKGDRDYYNRKGYPSMHLQVKILIKFRSFDSCDNNKDRKYQSWF